MTASSTTARSLLTAVLACAAGAAALPATSSAAFGEAHTLAPFPASPGFPEGVAVKGDRVYAAGAASLGTTGSGPSAVIAYDRATGAVVRRYDIVGENLLAEHGGSSIAFDGEGRLYVLDTQLGVLRINTQTGAQEQYSPPFPHLKPCLPLLVKPPCTPNPHPISPLPNDIAFAPNGDAYVTDSFQATIWRIPKGGGTPQIWFQSPKFASAYIGVNGLRLNPAGTRVYVTVTIDLEGRASLYSLPLKASPVASDLQLEHRFAPAELPDGVAFGATGQLFIAMASPTAPGFIVRNTDGTIAARVKNPPLSLNSPFDGPANIAFDGAGHILMTNHAPVSGLVLRQFSIVDVDATDNGAPLFKPMIG